MRVSKFSSPSAGPTVGGPNFAASTLRANFAQVETLGAHIVRCQILEKHVLQADAEGIKVDRDDCHQVSGEESFQHIEHSGLDICRPF